MGLINPRLLIFSSFLMVISVQLANAHYSLYAKTNKIPRAKLPPLPGTVGPRLAQLDEKLSLCGRYQVDIRELTISKVQMYFKKNQLTSVELTLCYLARIREMNPDLKAVIETNKQAVAIAAKKDFERLMGMDRGPLHGIPMLIKDNIDTWYDMQTTAGAVAMEFVMPKKEADVSKRLRRAGAVIIGKSNLSEWAAFRGNNVPDGWSGRGGQTRNAYVLSSSPSGSSSGSAVGVSANLATVAIGTETDGSVLSPSSCASLVGLKTTVGSVSTNRVIPLSFSQDTVGPMTRSVTDAAIVLKTIYSGSGSLRECGYNVDEWSKLKNFRVGVIRTPFWNASDSTIRKRIPALEDSLRALQSTGKALIVNQIPNDSEAALFDKISGDIEQMVFSHEFKFGLNKYLKEQTSNFEFALGRRVHSLADIIRFNQIFQAKEGYDQQNLIDSQATDGISNKTYKALRDQNKQAAEDYINTVLSRDNLDVLAGPCESDETRVLYNAGAVAGFPSITLELRRTEYRLGYVFLEEPILSKL